MTPTTGPIHDVTSEQMVIGSVLLAPAVLLDLGGLTPNLFHIPEHQTIFTAISHLENNRLPIDHQTVWNQIVQMRNNRGRIDTPTYLFECTQTVITPANAGFHAKTVRDCAARRATIAFATRMQDRGADMSTDVAQLLDDVARNSKDLVDSINTGTNVPTMQDLLEDAVGYVESLANGEGQQGVLSTGFTDLDRLTNGMRPGQLICIAARPGVGKTALALDILRHNALRDGRSVLMFSLEMSSRELMLRLIAAEADVPLVALLSGEVNDAQWAQIARCYTKLANANISIIDDASISIMDAKRLSRLVAREKGNLDLIIIDYLQLMRSGVRAESRQLEVADISRNAKILAKEMNVPVIALSQLNRAVEARNDKKPALSDLRDSGAIEQDSDVVLMIHREEMYLPDTPRVGEADLFVAKNRSGPQGNIILTWLGSRSMFLNAAHVYQKVAPAKAYQVELR